LVYEFVGSHYVGMLNISYDFRGTEQLTVSRSGKDLVINQAVSGKIRWPTTPGGFTAIPYQKWTEYLDSAGNVQRHIDALQDDMITDFSFQNAVTATDQAILDIGGDRVAEARVFINLDPRTGFAFWSWINPLWPGQANALLIGKRIAGEIVSGWIPKWLVPAKTYSEAVSLPIKLGPDMVAAGKPIPTLTAQFVYIASHPSKPGSAYLFADYQLTLTMTLFWDRATGLLVRSELMGVSNNPLDTSQLSLTHSLTNVSGLALGDQVQTTTALSPAPAPPAMTTPAVTTPTGQIVQQQPGPPLLPIAAVIVATVLAVAVALQRRRPKRRRK